MQNLPTLQTTYTKLAVGQPWLSNDDEDDEDVDEDDEYVDEDDDNDNNEEPGVVYYA